MAVTDICRDRSGTHPTLRRKVDAVLGDVRPLLPKGWTLEVFETQRTPERAAWLLKTGKSKTTRSKHCLQPNEAEDIVFKHNGAWTWQDPVLTNGKRGWQAVESSKRAHNLRIITWDKPHCELKPEDR